MQFNLADGSSKASQRQTGNARCGVSWRGQGGGGFGAVPLARETLDEVLRGYRRPNDKVSEGCGVASTWSVRRCDPVQPVCHYWPTICMAPPACRWISLSPGMA